MGVSVLLSQSPVRQTMKGFYSIFAALCLTASTNALPALPLFSLVKFENAACNTGANNDRMGTCYTKQECENLNGKSTTTCAEGFGTCCEFSEVACGATISQNNTFLIKDSVDASSSCTYKICPTSKNVCRIKFQFDALTLADPIAGTAGDAGTTGSGNSVGACNTDMMFISGGSGNASPVICGTNTGQHMIMDSDGKDTSCNTININIGAGSTSAKWTIAVTQYDCVDMTALENTAGPEGCLQYHLGDKDGAGRVDNFGYPGVSWPTTIGSAVTHLQDQKYNVCIRRHAKSTTICYTVVPAGAVAPGSASDQGGFGLSAQADDVAKSAVDAGCTTDFITIPNGAATGTIAAFKFCGSYLNNAATATITNAVVCSNQTPFEIGVNFDGSELVEAGKTKASETETLLFPSGLVGFHLTFAQS